MSSRGPGSLYWKLLAGIVPVVLLGVALIVWVHYAFAKKEIMTAIDRENRLLSQLAAASIDDLLRQRGHDLQTLSETPLIADYYNNTDFGLRAEAASCREQLKKYFQGFAKRTRVYSRIAYWDASGREVASVPEGNGPCPCFQEAKRRGAWVSDVLERPKGPTVCYGKAVYSEAGEFKGVLTLGYSLAQMGTMLEGVERGRSDFAYIEAGGRRFPDKRSPGETLSAKTALFERPWSVVVETPLAEALKPLRTIRDVVFGTAMVGVTLLLVCIFFLVRSSTRPIAALVEAARKLGAGDLSHRVEAEGCEEVSALSKAFNEMAGNLEANRARNGELQSQLIQAEKVAAAGLLISSVAHELSNPLTAVSGHAQLLQHRSWPDGLKETFEQIHINANRCSRVVQNMLFFVRASKGDRKPLMLNEVVESSLELLQYRFVKIDGVEVVRELEAGLPKALGDYQQLSQVLVNLINNACDAMQAIERGSGKRRIVLRTRREGARAVVEVEDAGTGVPEELFGRVFEAFVTTKPSGKGTGLGLYICKQIMAGHGGSISFYNRENGGAVFALELPLADGAAVVREEVVVEAPAVPGKRVLVVDDEEGAARVICATLADEGDEVVAVGSGSEALRELEKGADLVVSDIEMEGVNGYELFKRMREGGSKVPVLFVTGNILEQGVLDFLVRVEAAYMVKPFRVEGLRRAVRRMLAGERLRGLQK